MTHVSGFSAILFIGFEEYSFLVKAGFLFGSLGNLAVYLFWSRVKRFALPVIYILDAILYCTKAFKLHEHGSPHAYMFFYFIGTGYFIAGLIVLLYRDRLKH